MWPQPILCNWQVPTGSLLMFSTRLDTSVGSQCKHHCRRPFPYMVIVIAIDHSCYSPSQDLHLTVTIAYVICIVHCNHVSHSQLVGHHGLQNSTIELVCVCQHVMVCTCLLSCPSFRFAWSLLQLLSSNHHHDWSLRSFVRLSSRSNFSSNCLCDQTCCIVPAWLALQSGGTVHFNVGLWWKYWSHLDKHSFKQFGHSRATNWWPLMCDAQFLRVLG